MITELTQEQKDKMPEYVRKWIEIGTDTSRLEYGETKTIVNAFRELIGMESTPLVIVENPIEAWVTCCLHEQSVATEDLQKEMVKVFHGNPEKRNIPRATLPYQTGSFFAAVFPYYDYFFRETNLRIDQELFEKWFCRRYLDRYK